MIEASVSSSASSPLLQANRESVEEAHRTTTSNAEEDPGWFCWRRREFVEEASIQLQLAGPLVAVGLLTFSLHIISLMFVGHLGEIALSGASMAISFAYVTGFSLLLGLASALETTCGQSYGAKQYHMLGIHTQRATFILLLICIPLSFIWANAESILTALGQDHYISAEAGSYAFSMIPGLFAYGILQCLGAEELLCQLLCLIGTRVSNLLGAGRPRAARLAGKVVLLMTMTEAIVVGLVLVLLRNVWGYAYSSEMEVIKYLATMMPLLAITNIMDGLTCVLSGIARGCGWQKIGAFINLASFYILGIPSAILLSFTFKIGGRGLWLGIMFALLIQVTALLGITIRTNWEQEAKNAAQRIRDSKFSATAVP